MGDFSPKLVPESARDFDHEALRTELKFTFARSGGPGGQGVNTSDTKAVLRWKIKSSRVFSSAEKAKIAENLSGMINKEGELVLSCQVTRSQRQNRELALEKFLSDLKEVLRPIVPRIATKKSPAVRSRELDAKTRHGKLKQDRRWKYTG
jgi:ribosome-associated protein